MYCFTCTYNWGHLPIIALDDEQYAFLMPCPSISEVFTLVLLLASRVNLIAI